MKKISACLTALLLGLTTISSAAEAPSYKMKPPQNVEADMLVQFQHLFTQLNEAAGKLTVIPSQEEFAQARSRFKDLTAAEFRDKPMIGLRKVRMLNVLQAAVDLQHDESIPMGEKAAIYLFSVEMLNHMMQSMNKIDR